MEMDISQRLSSFRNQTPLDNVFGLPGSQYHPNLVGMSVDPWWEVLLHKSEGRDFVLLYKRVGCLFVEG